MEGCRRATRDDLARIAELARGHREEVQAFRGGDLWTRREAVTEPFEARYEAMLDDPDAVLLVGTIDDVVIGFASGRVERLEDGAHLGVVTDLYVEAEAREIGVGEAIADELIAAFTARDCVGIDAWALPGDRNTKNFFEDQGFVSRGIVVHKRLGDPESP